MSLRLFRRGRRSLDHEVGVPETARSTACAAPSAAMYLDQGGDVRACCWNSLHPMGNVAEASLHDIWFGDRAEALRNALVVDDYSLGCHACAQMVARGNDELVFARTFDHLGVADPVGYPSEISFAMSNTCNLQCVMCRGEWSSSIRAHREKLPPIPEVYGEGFFEELREFLPHLRSAKFLGGEPFLQRETYRIWDLISELGLSVPCSIQTNATQWNRRVEQVLNDHQVSITVSLDGFSASTYESIRVGADHSAVMANVDRFREMARRRGTTFQLTWCLMPNNWHEFADYLLLADRLECDAGVNTVPEPERFDIERLSVEELERIVSQLEKDEAARLGGLTRNRHVWDHHIDRLRRLVATGREGTTVWIGAPTGPQPVAGALDVALDLVERWGAQVVADFTVGTDQRVTTFASPIAALRSESWLGSDAWEVMASEVSADPSAWTPVELETPCSALACFAGQIDLPGVGVVRARAISVDEVIGEPGVLGYRVLLVRGEFA